MSSYNVNTPTTAFGIYSTEVAFGATTGAGTDWPVELALASGASGFWSGYKELDVAAAALWRIRQWKATISLTRSVTITDNATSNVTTWTENISQVSNMALNGSVSDERDFAQSTSTGSASTLGAGGSTVDPLHSGSGVSGTDGAGAPFTSTFDSSASNLATFGFSGASIILDPATVFMAPFFSILCPFSTPVTGTPPTSLISMRADSGYLSNWGEFASAADRQYSATVTVRVPSVTGSGNSEISFPLGAHEPDPAGFTMTSVNMTGTVLIEPVKSFQFGGVWAEATGARILHPHTASPLLVIP